YTRGPICTGGVAVEPCFGTGGGARRQRSSGGNLLSQGSRAAPPCARRFGQSRGRVSTCPGYWRTHYGSGRTVGGDDTQRLGGTLQFRAGIWPGGPASATCPRGSSAILRPRKPAPGPAALESGAHRTGEVQGPCPSSRPLRKSPGSYRKKQGSRP